MVFSSIDRFEDPSEVAGNAAQMASDVLELVLHCVDPALRDSDGAARVNSDRVENCLMRLDLNLRVLRELASKALADSV